MNDTDISIPPATSTTQDSTTTWQTSMETSPKSKKFIKRFDDFQTVDWIKESVNENKRQFNAMYKRTVKINDEQYQDEDDEISSFIPTKSKFNSLKDKLSTTGQIWFVLTMIGISIGLIAASLNIITEWLGSLKMGYCSTNFYLNRDFCCWGEEEDICPNWNPWSKFVIVNYLIFILISVVFGSIAAILCKIYAPTAAGSGISEVKCIVSGFVMDGFLGWWTLLIKSIALPLVIASGLSVGKEGPSVHYAACVGNVIPKLFKKFGKSHSNLSQFLTAASAAGVAVAFASPIGGVLFSIEEITSNFRLSTMWKSYYCALIATATLSAMNPFRTGQIVLFEVNYDSNWKYFEVPFFIILGIFGGVYGIIVAKANIKFVAFRQRYLSNHAVKEVFTLCLLTSMIGYFNEFIRLDMTEAMEILFHECGAGFEHNLCKVSSTSSKLSFFTSLVYATILRMVLVVISYGSKVPCGIFVPSMAAGATFGRAIGLIVESLYPCSSTETESCIISGTYAFLGAAATLSGITHLTLTVVIVMFELTGAIKYIIPTMIVVGVTKIINDHWGNGCGGIADQMIKFNGLPFIDAKEDHDFFDSKISDAMTDQVVALPVNGLCYQDLEILLADTTFRSFPIIFNNKSGNNPIVLGYIDRIDLISGMSHYKREASGELPLNKKIRFLSNKKVSNLMFDKSDSTNHIFDDGDEADDEEVVEFERYVNLQFLKVNIGASLYTVLDIFLKLGPRFIIVEDRGSLAGIISRKDLIKFELYLHHLKHGDLFVTDADEVLFGKAWKLLIFIGSKIDMVKYNILSLVGKGGNNNTRYMEIDLDE
ncbi:hypothetical protein CANARDRAFT_28225 [[Candida] arabinofermentans NRRL YB-2248]|uniref:Chloride channel protein n=1 Tax=[Candida] arabinofermentans NRRL YB-2248 TaxID=983967 RepID=A0A1E4T128_9ASCO|nr:hypothetical protein CANARDRAFT_28225 [[Candida] arabinofermentans NRRL YB-2248]